MRIVADRIKRNLNYLTCRLCFEDAIRQIVKDSISYAGLLHKLKGRKEYEWLIFS
ncbi:hypothetical protein HMPREF9624_01294 [Oribacterium asaccharolyticum ACB7]|uniref:Uncharacterized protein n=1 Tax=Oribacterium asaccharolyticum ACB7 TaxID=796944 RepID=G9WWL0_9FIRM|nr:hypothetical protein HMPREF9624_01294 [Oribacterium asaccharolyticum ACB7]